ncbi:cell wall hydrolase [Erythrobacter sp.]|uniref:cell wall hydrolase n=1 Tax=Erythrobacter sp. TaxID=1042 RepID=UPI00345CCD14
MGDEKLKMMTFTRLVLTIMTLFAAATLPKSSAVPSAPGTGNGGPVLRVSLAEPASPLIDLSPSSLEPLSEIDAREANLRTPFSSEQLEAALPLSLPLEQQWFLARASATDCLTAAIHYEAATESAVGKRAVAQVILNRVRHPAFPNSVCEVVMQGSSRVTGCQFTFTCDGSLYRRPSRYGWQSARQIALAALSGAVEPSVGMATHYHANYVRPYWASSLDKVAAIGSHIFYRWSGSWGKRRAFDQVFTLDRDYNIHQAMQWKSAASYLHGVDVVGFDVTFEPPVDQRQQAQGDIAIPADPGPHSSPQTATKLQADRAQGSLLADELAGTLIAD